MSPTANTYDIVLDSPLGKLGVQLQDDKITRLDYLGNRAALTPATTPLGRQITSQLANYFAKPQCRFTLPFKLHGTDFQLRVWQALTQIPSGKTLTYGELADRLGSGARAVGNACRNNPVSIVVPCHRVIAVSGIGGYSGKTDGREINRKKWLLAHEGAAGEALKTHRKAPTSWIQQKTQRNLHA
jgi:methylated-DNA-[protein]-cysteine S-methyltransferase